MVHVPSIGLQQAPGHTPGLHSPGRQVLVPVQALWATKVQVLSASQQAPGQRLGSQVGPSPR